MRLSFTGSPLLTFLLRSFIYLILLVFTALSVSAFLKMRERDRREACLKRMSKVAQAMWRYAEAHNGQLPLAAAWADDITSKIYTDDGLPEKCFKCPGGNSDQRSHYGFNARLSGISISNVSPSTVMLFEIEGGWNVAGGPELMSETRRHAVAFADGSTHMVTSARLVGLRWEP